MKFDYLYTCEVHVLIYIHWLLIFCLMIGAPCVNKTKTVTIVVTVHANAKTKSYAEEKLYSCFSHQWRFISKQINSNMIGDTFVFTAMFKRRWCYNNERQKQVATASGESMLLQIRDLKGDIPETVRKNESERAAMNLWRPWCFKDYQDNSRRSPCRDPFGDRRGCPSSCLRYPWVWRRGPLCFSNS